jgi:anthranilate synthase component 1
VTHTTGEAIPWPTSSKNCATTSSFSSLVSLPSQVSLPSIFATFSDTRTEGGAIGYVAYDCVRHFEPKTAREMQDPLDIPESLHMLCDSIVAFDHLFQTLYIISHVYIPPSQQQNYSIVEGYRRAREQIQSIATLLAATSPLPLPKQGPIPRAKPEAVSNIGKKGYEAHVTKMREHIIRGDIIQAVPSQRLARPTALHPFNAYRYLRQVNPSPQSR